jgi:hypothetical protein
MDRTLLLGNLEEAENHVVTGDLRIQRQREVLERLRLAGHDTTEAESTLAQLEELQRVVIAHRNWLVQALKLTNPE